MTQSSIQISNEALDMLLQLRRSDAESLDTVLRRLLPSNPVPRATASTAYEAKRLRQRRSHSQAYVLFGERHVADSAMDALTQILVRLNQITPNFFERLAPLIQGTSRNHLSRNRFAVYPMANQLSDRVREIVPGWYLGRNISNQEKMEFLVKACRLAGVQIGKDLIITFGRD